MIILIVDSDRNSLKLISKRLEINKHEVMCAEKDDLALQIMRESNIDLLIIDYHIPEKGSLNLLVKIKKRKTPRIRWVMSSETSVTETLVRLFGAGKIFKKEDIFNVLKSEGVIA